jgi:hypothetical protein
MKFKNPLMISSLMLHRLGAIVPPDGYNIKYLLYDDRDGGTPSKVAQVRRYSNKVPQIIPYFNKEEVPSAKQPQESIWFEDCVPN